MNLRNSLFTFFLIAGVFLSFPSINSGIIEEINSLFHSDLNVEFWNFGMQHFGIELTVLGGALIVSSFIAERNRFFFYISAAVLLFFIFLFQWAVNIPITDDYYALLAFSNNYFTAGTASEKFSLLTSFYHDSRIILIRSALVFLHFITGEVNFKTPILIFNLLLLIILFLFYRSIKYGKSRPELILIITLMLFQFGSYDAILWLIPAVHYKIAICCLMLALFFIRENELTLQAAALIMTLTAVLTVGNGWLIFPVVMLFFIITSKWKLLFVWAVSGAFIFFFYFKNFPMIKQELSYPSLINYFIFSCCFLGSAFQFLYKFELPFMAGLFIWILFAVITFKKYYNNNFVIYGLIAFVLISSIMAAKFRLDSGGLEEAISNRYGFYSILVFSASIIAFFENFSLKNEKIILRVLLLFSIVFHLLSGILFFPEVPIRKQKLEQFISDMKQNKPFRPSPPVIPGNADIIVRKALENEIYFP